jgi:inner membrane protein
MEPMAHTLVGAALAQTGLGRRTRFGTAALIIGANLPDIDAVTYFIDGDLALCARRGWTHGVLALVALPLILTGALVLLGRILGSEKPPPRAATLLGLSSLAVVTHPSLDWLNTYGIRWLMPLNGRWFYGDALFIVDPWIWLILGTAVFLCASRTRVGLAAWALLAVVATLLWFSDSPSEYWVAKALWLTVLAFAIGLRFRQLPGSEAGKRRLARGALALTSVYIGLMVASVRYARHRVIGELRGQGVEVQEIMVGPLPVTPFVRDVVVVTPDHYRYGSLELLPRWSLQLEEGTLPKLGSSPITKEAFRSPEVRGLVNWIRFPFVEVEENQTSYIVTIMDARYARARSGGRGFGRARVVISKDRAGGS